MSAGSSTPEELAEIAAKAYHDALGFAWPPTPDDPDYSPTYEEWQRGAFRAVVAALREAGVLTLGEPERDRYGAALERARGALAALVEADGALTEHQFHCDSSPCETCDVWCERIEEAMVCARMVLADRGAALPHGAESLTTSVNLVYEGDSAADTGTARGSASGQGIRRSARVQTERDRAGIEGGTFAQGSGGCGALESHCHSQDAAGAEIAREAGVLTPPERLHQAEVLLRRVGRCPYFGHDPSYENPRERRVDCADDQCRNPNHTTYVVCDHLAHDVAEFLAGGVLTPPADEYEQVGWAWPNIVRHERVVPWFFTGLDDGPPPPRDGIQPVFVRRSVLEGSEEPR